MLTPFSNLLVPTFKSSNAGIHPTVRLEWLKVNTYDVATGKQITDPTIEVEYTTDHRGGFGQDNAPALTTACRISIDDGTRQARRRGGFFLPRYAPVIERNGRYLAARQQITLEAWGGFLNDVNDLNDVRVAVWSRKFAEVAAVTRVRVGDVPDNISLRKNALPENYVVQAVTP